MHGNQNVSLRPAHGSGAPIAAAVLGLAVFGLAAFGLAAPARAVVGPTTADEAFKNSVVMVLASSRDANGHGAAGFCTGALLARDVVLTAAHCVPAGAELRVFFRDASAAPVLLPVADVALHPLYRADAERRRVRSIDLALVHLETALPASFRPLQLPAPSLKVALGDEFQIAGFGVSHEGAGSSSGVLRDGVLRARTPLSPTLLWADDPAGHGLGACEGDSGAPVLTRDAATIAAVANWATGHGRNHCGDLTQATLIAPQIGWIEQTLKAWRK